MRAPLLHFLQAKSSLILLCNMGLSPVEKSKVNSQTNPLFEVANVFVVLLCTYTGPWCHGHSSNNLFHAQKWLPRSILQSSLNILELIPHLITFFHSAQRLSSTAMVDSSENTTFSNGYSSNSVTLFVVNLKSPQILMWPSCFYKANSSVIYFFRQSIWYWLSLKEF